MVEQALEEADLGQAIEGRLRNDRQRDEASCGEREAQSGESRRSESHDQSRRGSPRASRWIEPLMIKTPSMIPHSAAIDVVTPQVT